MTQCHFVTFVALSDLGISKMIGWVGHLEMQQTSHKRQKCHQRCFAKNIRNTQKKVGQICN